jgi:hypothetical protein
MDAELGEFRQHILEHAKVLLQLFVGYRLGSYQRSHPGIVFIILIVAVVLLTIFLRRSTSGCSLLSRDRRLMWLN